jgi:dolichyl-phosphate beta-glucosyltransferase
MSTLPLQPVNSISVVIPAFNEDARIPPTLRRIDEYLKEHAYKFEIIVVDDGSSDGTADVVLGESERMKSIRLLRNESNRGKGFSVRRGVLSANHELVLISDADLSTPIEEIEKFMPWIGQGYEVVIGSRALRESDIIRKQPWYRQSMGKVFNALVRVIVLGGFHDTQCGFKMFRSGPAKEIFGVLKTERFAFDVEVLLRAKKMGYRIREVPVRWMNSPQSRVDALRDSFRMFVDLLRIRASLR